MISRVYREGGSALVELAVTLPFLLAILFGVADFARAYYTATELNQAARAGALYGAYSVANSNTGNMATVASTATSAVNLTGVSASATPKCYCASNDGTTMTPSPPTTAACTATCSSPNHLVRLVSVTASKTFVTIGRYPGVPSSVAITRTAVMRVSN